MLHVWHTQGARVLYTRIFSHIHTITRNANNLRVYAYTHTHYLFTRKVHFCMHTRVRALELAQSKAKKIWNPQSNIMHLFMYTDFYWNIL